MFNAKMFGVRNVLVIVAIAALTHVVARPLYNKIDQKVSG